MEVTPVHPALRLVIMTDPGRDQDDELMLIALSYFIRRGVAVAPAIIANLAPSRERARLAKGTLQQLGQPDIPVGVGSDCRQPAKDGLHYQFDVGYLADPEELQDGRQLLREVWSAAEPRSLDLLLVSGLTDAAEMLREDAEAFAAKLRQVTLMGAAAVENDELITRDEAGRFRPDLTAQNHSFDPDAADFLYRELQDREVPLTVLSRHAAQAAKAPRSIYDEMADTGHPVGIRLRQAQREAIERLWQRACLPPDDPNRHGLPARCDRAWFAHAFCDGRGRDRAATDSIWDLVTSFNLYDLCALTAAIPTLRDRFFDPLPVLVGGATHRLIGVSPARRQVREPGGLVEHFRQTLREGLRDSTNSPIKEKRR